MSGDWWQLGPYDEAALHERLAALTHERRAVFAAASAERVAPLYALWAAAGRRDDADVVATVLDDVWRALDGEDRDLVAGVARVEAATPPEGDPRRTDLEGYARDAALSVAAAAHVTLADDALGAVLAARQGVDVADMAAQRLEPLLGDGDGDDDIAEDYAAHPVVAAAIDGVLADLAAVEAGRSRADVRAGARATSEPWRGTLPT